ncbi:hypothetical protein AOL_s00097g419 [Orbilia oligospora ATCC 24927]|uniref:Uncharacterized protein n=1 Tax=Arthrobotrys oligospora (strain ATCC 24927 / CBS 115.81 / DSM 1491) TaxID=756982 RepID=G1XJ92_ARTOA|nr:hypothetical protein AOL_s00097g419 [Orbilia oligospora ATCC 24927]EGX46789.1 hypothetical protein AOL_s00097g419 [Orbilia oligospora ATCC 24927]
MWGRTRPGWWGSDEIDNNGDLLIILSQHRWFSLTGRVNGLKKVTSMQWLKEQNDIQGLITGLTTVIVYLAAALVTNIEQFGKILLLCQLMGSAGLLGITNKTSSVLRMHGGLNVKFEGRKRYDRRRDMVDELITRACRDDWAVKLDRIPREAAITSASIVFETLTCTTTQ